VPLNSFAPWRKPHHKPLAEMSPYPVFQVKGRKAAAAI